MKHQRIMSRVGVILANVIRHRMMLPSVPPEISLHDLCIDPIERVLIAAAVESEWNIALTDAEIDGWQTLEDIARSIGERT